MKAKIIRLTAAALLTVMMMLSLSSCIVDLEFYSNILDYLQDKNNGEGDNDGNGGDGNIGDNNENDGNNGDNGDTDPIPDVNITFPTPDESNAEFIPGSGQGNADGLDETTRMMLSTVSIVSYFDDSYGLGSGVIYKLDKNSGDAYIITNYHVIYTADSGLADSIQLFLYGMQLSSYAIPATFVGGSITYDIAVLKVSDSRILKNSYATAATPGKSDNVRVTDPIYVIGNGKGEGISATRGIISVESESLTIAGADGSDITLRVMRVDAAVNLGASGGGGYDEGGKLVGIIVAKNVSTKVDNIGYLIPVDLAVRIADNVIRNCNGTTSTSVLKPLMGVTITSYVSGLEITPDGKDVYEVNLVEVTDVSLGSLAYVKVRVGDIIKSITIDGNKYEVYRLHHVTDAMLEAHVGSVVKLEIERGGMTINVNLVVRSQDVTTVH